MNHQYIKITDIDKPLPGTQRGTPGAIIMCAICGEVKHIYADGRMDDVIEGSMQLHVNARPNN